MVSFSHSPFPRQERCRNEIQNDTSLTSPFPSTCLHDSHSNTPERRFPLTLSLSLSLSLSLFPRPDSRSNRGCCFKCGKRCLCTLEPGCWCAAGCRCQMCMAVCTGCWCAAGCLLPDVYGSARFGACMLLL